MKYVIGSGLTGLLAKFILGDDWQLIPQKRSRYYTFEPVLADNFIVREEGVVDEVVKNISPIAGIGSLNYFRQAFSFKGQLLFKEDDLTVSPYLSKIYGSMVPDLASKLLKSTFWTYNISAKALHDTLLRRYADDIKSLPIEVLSLDIKNKRMNIRNVGGNDKKTIDYETIVNTIPLDAFYNMCGIFDELSSRAICYYQIRSKKVDLEKSDQCLIVDDNIDFFKVTRTRRVDEYLFWTFDQIENPHEYFGMFLSYNLDLEGAYRIEGALPLGNPPDLRGLESSGIYCVGSNAQWDDFMDASSCIKRLTKLAGNI